MAIDFKSADEDGNYLVVYTIEGAIKRLYELQEKFEFRNKVASDNLKMTFGVCTQDDGTPEGFKIMQIITTPFQIDFFFADPEVEECLRCLYAHQVHIQLDLL
jgi:hypothetical protein